MPDTSIFDALFAALLRHDKGELAVIEAHRAEECARLRAVICTDEPGAIDLDLGFNLSSSESLTSFFEGPRAFFISAGAGLQARHIGGQSDVLIDFSLSFDSNFAEKMRAAIASENIQQVDRDRVNEILMLKARNRNVQFDVLPFLIENTRLTRDHPDNERPLNTLIAFRMLDHLDWDAFRDDPSQFVFTAPCEELRASLRPDAEAVLSNFRASEHVMHREAMSSGTQALLLRFARLWHENRKPDKVRILHELLRFSIHKLGTIALTELRLIWCGMTSDLGAPFFGPITGRSKTMLKEIRGMAWDMTLLRVMEQSATTDQFGSFFIPYFVSIDSRLCHLLRLNPVRFMLMDDVHKCVLFARADELAFQRVWEECQQTVLQEEMTPEKIEARRRLAQAIRLDEMQKLVDEEEIGWVEQALKQSQTGTR